MRCPFCGFEDTQVKDSRVADDGQAIRRRRVCPECGGRFTTFERVQLRELMVLKKNGETRPLERDKLVRSITIAARKRPITPDQIEQIVNNIIKDLSGFGESEIPTSVIGTKVMKALAEIDHVAYVRYASVYSDFQEAKDFEKFISKLRKK